MTHITYFPITRTTLQPEPILGGQKLDLYKLFREVQAAGGYQQVCYSGL
jgi:hypothetical protein